MLFLFVTFSSMVLAQMPSGLQRDSSKFRSAGGKDSLLKNAPAVAKVIGALKDSLTKEPIEFASIALLRLRDSVAIAGSLTNGKGQFSMEELPPGRYILRINSIGYRKMDSKPFMLSPMDPLKDFGTIYVSSTQKNLKEVEVTSEKADYINSLDKKVFNVDKDIVSTGGSASDVLKNVPSVNVDIDGKVSLRGSENLQILIDGKPSGLGGGDRATLLQQLPADAIEQIEIITNPSARYDAEGMAGIINIKTKKDRRAGLNGSLSAGVGTNDKYNGGITLNNRSKKTNTSFQYNYRQDARFSRGNSLRHNFYTSSESYYLTKSYGRNYNENQNAKLSFDYYLSTYSTLSLSGGIGGRFQRRNESIDYTFEDLYRNPYLNFLRNTKEIENSINLDGNIEFRHTIPGTKREFSASANISSSQSENEQNYLTIEEAVLTNNELLTKDGLFTVSTIQTDYIHPINDRSKFEAGLKATLRDIDNDQAGFILDSNYFYGVDAPNTDRFIYRDQVYAAYLQYAGKIKVFEFQAGLRSEATQITGDSKTTNSDFTLDYIDLFPSAAIKYVLKTKNELQVTYSRRINRPQTNALNPFIDFSDSLNVRTGNPKLDPEYISSYELNYFRRFGESSISATVYVRNTNNLIVRFRTVDPTTNVTTVTFTNFSSSENTGVEFVFKNQLTKKLSSTVTFNYFFNKVNATNVDSDLQSNNENFTVRGNFNYRLLPTTSLQISGMYMSPNKQPQGSFQGMNTVDIGIRHEFLKGKLSLSINVTDIFDIREFEIRNFGEGFDFYQLRKRESRVGNFNLSYRFGKSESAASKRKQSRQAEPQMDMNPDF